MVHVLKCSNKAIKMVLTHQIIEVVGGTLHMFHHWDHMGPPALPIDATEAGHHQLHTDEVQKLTKHQNFHINGQGLIHFWNHNKLEVVHWKEEAEEIITIVALCNLEENTPKRCTHP